MPKNFLSGIFIIIHILLISMEILGQTGGFTVTAIAEPAEICQGESVQLDVIVEGGSGSYAYTWSSFPPGFNTSLKNPVVRPDTTTYYFVKASDGPNTGYDTVMVVVNNNPQPFIGQDTLICSGDSITYDPGPGYMSYEWQDGSTQQHYTAAVEGYYWVVITNQYGCQGRDTAFLDILEIPVKPAKPAGPSFIDLNINTSSSYSTSTGILIDYEWELNPDWAGQIDSNGQKIYITWDTSFSGEATISVRTRNFCGYSPWSDSLRVTVVNTFGLDENAWMQELRIYPNPVRSNLTIQLEPTEENSLIIAIYNQHGTEVFRTDQIISKGMQNIELKLGQLPVGVYTLNLMNKHGHISHKLILSE